MAERRQTALGVARARFVEGLPRKAREVRASLALLTGTPDEDRPREELRRRLHALYASAQVFRIEPLAEALKEALAKIDTVRDAKRGFDQDELDALATLAATLPALGRDDTEAGPSVASSPAAPRAAPPKPVAPKPKPQPKRRSGVETIVSVLVVDDTEQQALVRAALPPERFEVLVASSAEEAVRIARSAAPDVVLADRAIVLQPGADLIGKLREDPLTDFVPIVMLVPPGTSIDSIAVREAGADDAIPKPLSAELVLRTVERVARTLSGPAGASTLTGELTLEELADRLADEVKRGIVEAAEKGRDVAVPVGDGTPLLAAAWSAIGRVRAHIAERSGGRIRFREAASRGGPAFVTVVGDEVIEDDLPEGFSLAGRRILVADDDPAVVWFFAGLFREHGADVAETHDGLEALENARRKRPDLVVSDILMPGLDGFGLTRALKRDPMLAEVPVILLSWKEDFLQRMRELKSGASGYLRKEAAAVQILAAVRDVLRPRTRLELRMKAGGDLRGRLEDVGIQTLVRTVTALRPDARLTVRDAASLFEIDVRGGEIVDVTRTASDGMFARGPRVLEALLGTTSGRYTVADADGPLRRSIHGSVGQLIDTAMRAIAARVDAVSGKNLARAAEVELEPELAASVVRGSPDEVERIVGHLREGRGPRQLLLDGVVEPQVLEGVLVDLARRGAIVRVAGPSGEDRISLAREARERGVYPEHDAQPSASWPPAARPSEAPLALDEEDLESLRPPPVPAGARPLQELEPPPERERRNSSEIPVLDEPFAEPTRGSGPPRAAVASDEPELETTEDDDDDDVTLEVGRDDEDEDAETQSDEDDTETDDEDDADTESDDEDDDAETESDEDDADTESDDEDDDAETESDEDDDTEADDEDDDAESDDEDDDAESDDEGDAGADDDVESGDAGAQPIAASAPEPAAEASSDAPRTDAPPSREPAVVAPAPTPRRVDERPRAPAPTPESRGMGLVAWSLVVLVLGAVGFVGWQLTSHPDATEEPGPVAPPPSAHAPDPPADDTTEPAPDTPPSDTAADPEGAQEEAALPAAYGREEDGIANVGVTVPAGQGLLVIETAPGGAAMTVRVGDRELAVAAEPAYLALPPGVHHLTFLRGDNQDFVWVAVRAGHTRYAPPLP